MDEIYKYMKNSPFWSSLPFLIKNDEDEVINKLKAVPVFEGIPDRGLDIIRSMCHKRVFKEGDHIFHSGDPGVGMYIILEGFVEIYRREKGREMKLTTLQTGDFFGELALLEDLPRTASAKALTYTRTIGFFRPDLIGLLARKPRLINKILLNLSKLIGRRLIRTTELLDQRTVYEEVP